MIEGQLDAAELILLSDADAVGTLVDHIGGELGDTGGSVHVLEGRQRFPQLSAMALSKLAHPFAEEANEWGAQASDRWVRC